MPSHAQQDETPQPPPVWAGPAVPEGLPQLNDESFFFMSLERQCGHSISSAGPKTSTLNDLAQTLQRYS